MPSKKLVISLICFIFLLSLAIRFFDLERDPFPYNEYGLGYVDEGGYVHSARNKVLFDQWALPGDTWNSLYLSPTYTFLQYLSFQHLGVSTFSMRLVSALLGIISLLIASVLVMKKERKAGIIYFILLSMNTMFVVYSRMATLQIMVVSLMLVIIGLIVHDSKKSWLLVGFLLPTLFLSKFTSLFFVATVPLSLLIYSRRDKNWDKMYLTKLGYVVLGGVFSLALWFIWLIPNFEQWLFTAQMLSHELKYSLFRVGAVFSHLLQFSYLNQIAVLLAGGWFWMAVQQWKIQKKIEYIDFFLFLAIALFAVHLFVVDFFIRRWILIIPLLLLMGTRFLCRLGEEKERETEEEKEEEKGERRGEGRDKSVRGFPGRTQSWQTMVIIILGIYVIFNLAPWVDYFGQSENSHVIISNSQELGKYIPAGEKVFGNAAIALGYENKYQPYYAYAKSIHVDTEKAALPLLQQQNINYAVLHFDLHNTEELRQVKINPDDPTTPEFSELYHYLKNEFSITHTLRGKHWVDGRPMNIYVYQRKSMPAKSKSDT